MNRYTYAHNDPIKYTDPTGHWVESDKDLNQDAQAEIISLTNAWWEASTKEERNKIEDKANEIRRDKANYEPKMSPLKVQKEMEINSVINQVSSYDNKYFSKEDWNKVISNAGISYTNEKKTNDGHGVNFNNTTTSIGRTDISVNITNDTNAGVVSLHTKKSYNVTPYEAKFINQVAPNIEGGSTEEITEKAVTLLDIMLKNGGTISESEVESVLGKGGYTSREEATDRRSIWNPLKQFEVPTAEQLMTDYELSIMNTTFGELGIQFQADQFDQAIEAATIPTFLMRSSTLRNTGNYTTRTWNDVEDARNALKKKGNDGFNCFVESVNYFV